MRGKWSGSWEVERRPGGTLALPCGHVLESALVAWLLLQGPCQRGSAEELLLFANALCSLAAVRHCRDLASASSSAAQQKGAQGEVAKGSKASLSGGEEKSSQAGEKPL